MENRQLTIITPDNEYYIDQTNYLIRGKLIFVHKTNLQTNTKILLKIGSMITVKSFKGEIKVLVIAASIYQYLLFFRSQGEDEIIADLDDFDLITKRNGNIFGDYVFSDLAIKKYREV
jgi:hypothetical protein